MNFDNRIDELKDDIIKSTQELVRIRSVQEEGIPGKPFGQGVHSAYEYTMDLADKLGFSIKDFDGYAGHADFGDGDETVGILVHLDVVPEGDNWSYPPYSAEIHDDKIFGRGTIDDKGPAISCLYAMKAINDSDIKLSKKVRIIFGLNEESGWGCMKHYLKKEKAPDVAFTPDADFPAIHGEKGIVIFDLKKKFSMPYSDRGIKLLEIKGGNRPNMVPDFCEAHITKNGLARKVFDNYKSREDVKLELIEETDRFIIKSYGISAHGSLPESGLNAISALMKFLSLLELCSGEVLDFINFYNERIKMEYYGESIGCGFCDEESGKLIFNVGVISLNSEGVSLSINIRYPVTTTLEEVYEGIKNYTENIGIDIVQIDHKKPLYISKDHELIKKLMAVYNEYTKDDSEPITIGGGTYARAMDNAVAFGPLFPGQLELAHQKDEYIGIEDLILMTKIYAKAIYELAK